MCGSLARSLPCHRRSAPHRSRRSGRRRRRPPRIRRRTDRGHGTRSSCSGRPAPRSCPRCDTRSCSGSRNPPRSVTGHGSGPGNRPRRGCCRTPPHPCGGSRGHSHRRTRRHKGRSGHGNSGHSRPRSRQGSTRVRRRKSRVHPLRTPCSRRRSRRGGGESQRPSASPSFRTPGDRAAEAVSHVPWHRTITDPPHLRKPCSMGFPRRPLSRPRGTVRSRLAEQVVRPVFIPFGYISAELPLHGPPRDRPERTLRGDSRRDEPSGARGASEPLRRSVSCRLDRPAGVGKLGPLPGRRGTLFRGRHKPRPAAHALRVLGVQDSLREGRSPLPEIPRVPLFEPSALPGAQRRRAQRRRVSGLCSSNGVGGSHSGGAGSSGGFVRVVGDGSASHHTELGHFPPRSSPGSRSVLTSSGVGDRRPPTQERSWLPTPRTTSETLL